MGLRELQQRQSMLYTLPNLPCGLKTHLEWHMERVQVEEYQNTCFVSDHRERATLEKALFVIPL